MLTNQLQIFLIMKTKSILPAFFIFLSQLCSGQTLKQEYQTNINIFIGHLINNNSGELSRLISYPLKRQYPIPAINNQQEFIKRFDEIFDDSLKNTIIDSDAATDWSEVGWRGIMLLNGLVWMDTDGKIIAINYQSKTEKQLEKTLIQADKNKLHPSLVTFKNPVCILETAKFRIRIDELSSGEYRYASWPITKTMSESPDLVLSKGKVLMDGSGGNHRFEFKNGVYLYVCSISPLRQKGTAPADLTVYKNETTILTQDAIIVNP